MPHKIYAGTIESISDIINGTLVLGPFPELPVGGRTLIFTAPAVTVTFSGAVGTYLSLQQIVAEIEATVGLAGYAKLRGYDYGPATLSRDGDSKLVPRGRVAIQADAGFTIGNLGTANSFFGLSTTAPTVGAGLVPAAKITGFTQGPVAGQLVIIISP